MRGRRHGQRHHHRAALTDPNPGPLVVGVDVGERTLDVVLLEGGAAHHVRVAPGALGEVLRAHRPACVAIDSPPGFRPPGAPVRRAERELLRRGIGLFVTPVAELGATHRFYGWMRTGAAVWRAAEEAGYVPAVDAADVGGRALETFPHAVAVALRGCRPPRMPAARRRAWRAAALADAGVDTAPLRSADAVDAALCALCAARALAGRAVALGDAAGGAIMLPVDRLPERFPPCA